MKLNPAKTEFLVFVPIHIESVLDLPNIARIRHCLTKEAASSLVHSLVASRIRL